MLFTITNYLNTIAPTYAYTVAGDGVWNASYREFGGC